jgi:hypothetical protein
LEEGTALSGIRSSSEVYRQSCSRSVIFSDVFNDRVRESQVEIRVIFSLLLLHSSFYEFYTMMWACGLSVILVKGRGRGEEMLFDFITKSYLSVCD